MAVLVGQWKWLTTGFRASELSRKQKQLQLLVDAVKVTLGYSQINREETLPYTLGYVNFNESYIIAEL